MDLPIKTEKQGDMTVLVSRLEKTPAAPKPRKRSNPFLQNFDHFEDICISFLNTFIQSIDLKTDKELAYRVCLVLEENALKTVSASRNILAADLSLTNPELEFGIEEDDIEETPPALDAIFFEGLSENFPQKRSKHLAAKKPARRYKPRYPDSEYTGTVDKTDWETVKTYFATRAEQLKKRGPGVKKGASPEYENLMRLASNFNLAEKEKNLLSLILAMHHTSRLQAFFYAVTGAIEKKKSRNPMLQCLARALALSQTGLAEILKNDAPLRAKGLIEDYNTDGSEADNGLPYVDDRILTLIEQPGITLAQMTNHLLGEPKTTRRNWNDFSGMGQTWSQLRRFVEGCIKQGKGANILLVGQVGLGKSDMIKALCKELKIPLYIPGEDANDITDDHGRPISPAKVRFDAWKYGMTLLGTGENGKKSQTPSAMFLDEVGDMLESGGTGKQTDGSYGNGILSRMDMHAAIEKSSVITFFAGNNQSKWDAGFLSRMDMAVTLNAPTSDYSQKIWRTVVAEQDMQQAFKEGDIAKLAMEFEISPRLMEKAVAFAKRTDGGLDDALFYLETIGEFLYGTIENVRTRQPDAHRLHPELLNAQGIEAGELLRRINSASSKPVTILVHGPDGTGKKLLVQKFAAASARRLHTISPDDILGRTYEETLTKTRTLFEEAAKTNAAIHFTGFDTVMNPDAIAQIPMYGTLCTHLSDQIKRSKVPIVMTARTESPEHIVTEIRNAFSTRARLGYLKEEQIAPAIEKLAGRPIPAGQIAHEVTTGDIEDALRRLDLNNQPDSDFTACLNDITQQRPLTNSQNHRFTL